MHRIWDIREVVERMIETLYLDTRDLRSVVRTCRSFHAIATPYIWKDVAGDDVYHLMNCVIKNPILSMSTAQRWERFHLFSSIINTMGLPGSLAPIELESFTMLCQVASIRAPFRRVTALSASLTRTQDFQWLLCMMHSPLESLHILLQPGMGISKDTTRSLLHALPQTLTHLVIRGHHRGAIGDIWPDNSELPSRLRSYESSLTTSLDILRHLPYLQNLDLVVGTFAAPDERITSSGFAALRTLGIWGDLGSMRALLEEIDGPLQVFRFTEGDRLAKHGATGDMCRALRRFSLTLREISLAIRGRSETNVAVPMKDFSPLNACHDITSFRLDYDEDNLFSDSNRFVEEMTRAWPKLRTFVFLFDQPLSSLTSSPSAAALISLAAHCPELETIALSYLELSEQPPTPILGSNPKRVFLHIHDVSVGECHDPTLWATFIGILWPKVDVKATVDSAEAARDWWMRVAGVLRAFEGMEQLRTDPKLLEDCRGQPLGDTMRLATKAASIPSSGT